MVPLGSCEKGTRKGKERQGPPPPRERAEGEQRQGTNKARKLTHRRGLRDGAKHGVAQSTASRKANQIASEKQIASSKQSTKYVDERSKARRHRSTARRRSKALDRDLVSISTKQYRHLHIVTPARAFFLSPPPSPLFLGGGGGAGEGSRMRAPAL